VSAEIIDMRDLVQVYVTSDLPVRVKALPFADRVELRFGKAFPVALIVDRVALDRLVKVLETGRSQLDSGEVR
jgi:hypothetical protein